MQGTEIEQQVSCAIKALGEADGLCEMLATSWRIYQCFLEEQDLLPEQAEDIPQSSFSMFVAKCEEQQMDDEKLHLVLAIVRVILLELGHDANTLSGLSAPRKRKRVSNGNDGRYRFSLVRATDPKPAAVAKSGSAPAGHKASSIPGDTHPNDPRYQQTSPAQMGNVNYQGKNPHTVKA